MKRLLFLLTLIVLFVSPLFADDAEKTSLFTTPVFLQIPSETSIGMVWGVNGPAAGFVEYSTKEDMTDAKRVYACVPPLRSIQEKVLSVRIRGLEPNTKYFYRAATMSVSYPNAYHVKVGEPEFSAVRSFTTLGANAQASFAVINDTHAEDDTVKAVNKKLKEFQPAVVVWNGDTADNYKSEDKAIKSILKPGLAKDYAFLFVPGNHDYRGTWVRNLDTVLLTRNPEERNSKYWALGRNFAVRLGDVALIGLDTGESKSDDNPDLLGLAEFESYRELQTQWLKETLERPDIKSAPFIVAFCHIPMIIPRDDVEPGQSASYVWSRTTSYQWGQLFKQHGVQVVITAHKHRYRCDEPTADRPWTHFVGGGKSPQTATVFHGTVEDGKLIIRVYRVGDDSIIKEVKFEKRKLERR
ncbi:MAG: metallophosphoesterase [Thermoguttaceae bacterium]|nr:metallophosphoesterase [Thermoguttaceae bacterium]